jgi:hypothetical protein
VIGGQAQTTPNKSKRLNINIKNMNPKCIIALNFGYSVVKKNNAKATVKNRFKNCISNR